MDLWRLTYTKIIKMETIYQTLEHIQMDDDEEDEYSDKYKNYIRVQETVTFLKNGGRVTEEWMEEHRKHILAYREAFPNFAEINEEVKDLSFRKTAQETEVLLTNLIESIRVNRFFNVKFYRMLNEHMIELCEHFFTEEELEFCMSKMSI